MVEVEVVGVQTGPDSQEAMVEVPLVSPVLLLHLAVLQISLYLQVVQDVVAAMAEAEVEVAVEQSALRELFLMAVTVATESLMLLSETCCRLQVLPIHLTVVEVEVEE